MTTVMGSVSSGSGLGGEMGSFGVGYFGGVYDASVMSQRGGSMSVVSGVSGGVSWGAVSSMGGSSVVSSMSSMGGVVVSGEEGSLGVSYFGGVYDASVMSEGGWGVVSVTTMGAGVVSSVVVGPVVLRFGDAFSLPLSVVVVSVVSAIVSIVVGISVTTVGTGVITSVVVTPVVLGFGQTFALPLTVMSVVVGYSQSGQAQESNLTGRRKYFYIFKYKYIHGSFQRLTTCFILIWL
jgi:hypothetical protein